LAWHDGSRDSRDGDDGDGDELESEHCDRCLRWGYVVVKSVLSSNRKYLKVKRVWWLGSGLEEQRTKDSRAKSAVIFIPFYKDSIPLST
jgi:hypothetical protein